MVCISKAIDWALNQDDSYDIFMNMSPELINLPFFFELINQPHLKELLPRMVFEITEHLPIPTAEKLSNGVDYLKRLGIRLALDDTGCGFADLDAIRVLRPDVVKLCITVTSRVGRHPNIEKDIRNFVAKAENLGGIVLGEGIERKEQAEILKNCGVYLGQGYYHGRPQPIREPFWVDRSSVMDVTYAN